LNEHIPDTLREYLILKDKKLADRANVLWELSEPLHARETKSTAYEGGYSHCLKVEEYVWALITKTRKERHQY